MVLPATRLVEPAEAALAPVELAHRVRQLARAELGPRRLDEQQLGIGGLPEQEVAEALLAAGAHQEIHVAGEAVAEPLIERFALQRLTRSAARGGQDRIARGVVHRD